MLFDMELDGGYLHYLMAIGVGVKSCEFLCTTSASVRIVVADSRTVFYSIQGTAMTRVSGLPPSLFSRWLLFLGLLDVGRV
jgi:hypothetical protein